MTKKLVSIIITAHNQEEFLEDCLNSFYNQKTTYPYELILIDDNSKDNTEKLVKEKYPEVGYFKVHYNNACKTRNYGLSKVNGDYIGWFDGDDYPADNYIEGLANELDKNKKINFAYPKIYYPNCTIEDNFITACYSWEFSESLLRTRGCLGTMGLLRKEFAEKIKWDKEMGEKKLVSIDWDYYLTALKKGLKGRLVHNALFYYRLNPKSLWGKIAKTPEKIENSRNYILKKHNLRKGIEKVDCTFVSVISREFCLDRYFDCIKKLKMQRKKMHWFIYVDSKDEKMIDRIREFAEKEGKRFYSWRMFATMRSPVDNENKERRKRQRDNFITILKELRHPLVKTPYFFMLEDDTIPEDENAFYKLRKNMRDGVAMVLGVEASRSETKVLGVAKLKWDNNNLLERHCLKPKRKGVEEVDGTGWYCFVGRTDAFKEEYIPDIYYDWANSDVVNCWKLRQAGWKILVDWSIWCKHIYLEDGKIKERTPDEAEERVFKLIKQNE